MFTRSRSAEGMFTPPSSTASRRRRRLTGILLALAAVVVLLPATVYLAVPVLTADECDPLWRDNDECVGVTDGSFVFDPRLQAVESLIRDENRRIQDERGVTVAVLMPMTLRSDSNNLLTIEQIRAHLEGAHIAQLEANKRADDPKIRLLLANEGSQEQAWQPVIGRLDTMVDDRQPLVTVTGLGVSIQQTVDGAKELARRDIPMVGSVISADDLNTIAARFGGPVNGLVRVSPSNRVEAAAIARYLQKRDDLTKAMLVVDRNLNDFYTSDLAQDYKTQLRSFWEAAGSPVMPYDGTPGTPGITTQFQEIAGRLCPADAPDMAFYAGRAALLPSFVTQLRDRGCARDRNFTVVTGSDAAGLQAALPRSQESDAPVSVIYAGIADPAALGNQQLNPDWASFARFQESFTAHFDPADLQNGWAIMAHDALLTAANAIRKASKDLAGVPRARGVRPFLYLLNDASNRVIGASGSFSINQDTGDVAGRRLPIVELRPDGTKRVLSFE